MINWSGHSRNDEDGRSPAQRHFVRQDSTSLRCWRLPAGGRTGISLLYLRPLEIKPLVTSGGQVQAAHQTARHERGPMDQSLLDPGLRNALLQTVAADLAAGTKRTIIAEELVRNYGISSDKAEEVIRVACLRQGARLQARPDWMRAVAKVVLLSSGAVALLFIALIIMALTDKSGWLGLRVVGLAPIGLVAIVLFVASGLYGRR